MYINIIIEDTHTHTHTHTQLFDISKYLALHFFNNVMCV